MRDRLSDRFTLRHAALVTLLALFFLSGCERDKPNATPAAQTQAARQAPLPNQDAAIKMIKARLQDDPENIDLLAALGDLYFEQRRFEEAIPIYQRVITFDPKNFDALNDLGLAYYYTGDAPTALKMLDRSAAANPDYKFARLSKGYILLSLGRYEEAEAPLRKAQELDPNGGVGAEAGRMLEQVAALKAGGR